MKTASSCCCCLTVASSKNCSCFHCFKIQSLSILSPSINGLLSFCLTNLKLSLVIETVYPLLVTELIDMMLMEVVGTLCKLRMRCSPSMLTINLTVTISFIIAFTPDAVSTVYVHGRMLMNRSWLQHM
jgi:hypothetical protein